MGMSSHCIVSSYRITKWLFVKLYVKDSSDIIPRGGRVKIMLYIASTIGFAILNAPPPHITDKVQYFHTENWHLCNP